MKPFLFLILVFFIVACNRDSKKTSEDKKAHENVETTKISIQDTCNTDSCLFEGSLLGVIREYMRSVPPSIPSEDTYYRKSLYNIIFNTSKGDTTVEIVKSLFSAVIVNDTQIVVQGIGYVDSNFVALYDKHPTLSKGLAKMENFKKGLIDYFDISQCYGIAHEPESPVFWNYKIKEGRITINE